MKKEVDLVVERYARRAEIDSSRYSMMNPEIWQRVHERQRNLIKLINANTQKPISDLKVLEIGCGSGGNLLELIRLGFSSKNLIGNELLPERVSIAQQNLPLASKVEEGDACLLKIDNESLDIVYQSTVFSSLLDNEFQQKLAKKMWSWVKPGGGVLWYDFTYNNPKNKDVRGVPISRIKELFPESSIIVKKVTLAPPISRKVCKLHPSFYTIANSLPFLRTHVICWIGKN